MDSPVTTETPAPAQPAAEPAARRRRGPLLGNVLLLTGTLGFTALLSEILIARFAPLTDPYWRHKTRPEMVNTYIPSQFALNLTLDLQPEPGLPGMKSRSRFSVNNIGFRGDSMRVLKPADEVRIFVVGGSTTECLYLDDADAVTRVMQDSLRSLQRGRNIRVYGAGKSGDKTYDHLAMVGHRIAHLQPDLILVFPGVNDLLAATHHRDFLFLPLPRDSTERPTWSLLQLMRLGATELQLGRLAFRVLKPRGYQDAVEQIHLRSDIRAAVESRRSRPLASEPPPTQLGHYRENLKSIIAVARAQGARIALITQASTWNSKVDTQAEGWHWMNIGLGKAYSEEAMDAALSAYNETVRVVGAELNVPVFDLAGALPKSMDYFYDDVHFNVKGAARAGGMFARFVTAADLLPHQ